MFLGPGPRYGGHRRADRRIDMTDNATPSGWSLAAEALLTASALTWQDGVPEPNRCSGGRPPGGIPTVLGHGLAVLVAWSDGPREVA